MKNIILTLILFLFCSIGFSQPLPPANEEMDFYIKDSSAINIIQWFDKKEPNTYYSINRTYDYIKWEEIGIVGLDANSDLRLYTFADINGAYCEGKEYQVIKIKCFGSCLTSVDDAIEYDHFFLDNNIIKVYNVTGNFLFEGTKEHFLKVAERFRLYIVITPNKRYKIIIQ